MEYVRRHYVEQHTESIRSHQCERCLKGFKRKQHLKRHSLTCNFKKPQTPAIKTEDTGSQYNCCFCNIWFNEEEELFSHWKNCHPLPVQKYVYRRGHTNFKSKIFIMKCYTIKESEKSILILPSNLLQLDQIHLFIEFIVFQFKIYLFIF